ncbi:MAG: hypothetical protein ACI35R_12555 [Bacillus sp. (in: firmicutes)]
MRLISTEFVKPEAALGKSIYNAQQQILLNEGVVSQQNKGLCDRPIITIVKENGQEVVELYEFALNLHLHAMIIDCNMDN